MHNRSSLRLTRDARRRFLGQVLVNAVTVQVGFLSQFQLSGNPKSRGQEVMLVFGNDKRLCSHALAAGGTVLSSLSRILN